MQLFRPILLLVLGGAVNARRCGTSITDECESDHDRRYDPNVPTDLFSNARAWQRVNGLYSGILYRYNAENLNPVALTQYEQFAYPTQVYLNISVSGTRVYRHMFMFRIGADPIATEDLVSGYLRIGQQVQCDSLGFATWEKDGIAANMRSICSTDASETSETFLPDESKAYPIDAYGVKFEEIFHAGSVETPKVTLASTFKCISVRCPMISIIEETFEGTDRVAFEIGDLESINSTAFVDGVNAAPETFVTGETGSVYLPMSASCLNEGRCYTDREICDAGDPSDFCRDNYAVVFTESPYQDESGDIKPGAVAAFVLASLIFAIGLIYTVYLIMRNQQVFRYRYFFATRMIDSMETDKHLDEFTADDVNKEYEHLVELLRGKINQESMYEWLSTGELGYMDWGDFAVLWAQLDRDKSGDAGFLEFCSFLGHSWAELEACKAERVGYSEQGGAVPDNDGDM